ncbi:hypothetical protein NL676_000645 [Syzygium grande]|nr:hypothetical protein NL676_000645 [Syzygium grande]
MRVSGDSLICITRASSQAQARERRQWRRILPAACSSLLPSPDAFDAFRPSSSFSSSSSSLEPFEPPPAAVAPRRVVVTGLGMVTPLGCGVETTWKRLIEGKCGVRAITPDDLKMDNFDRETRMHTFEQLTSKVAATVPGGTDRGEFNEELWLNSKEHRSIARFIGYALCAADEALRDANWITTEQEQKEMTGVSIGGGTGSISDILDAAQMICEKRLR